MANETIHPKTIAELFATLTPMSVNLSSVASALDILNTTVGQVKDDHDNTGWIIQVQENINSEKEQVTKFKDILIWGDENVPMQPLSITVPPTAPAALDSGIVKRTMALIVTIKKHHNYTEAIGKLLGIIGPEISEDFSAVKSVIKVKQMNPEGIELTFKKLGADGVIIWSYVYDSSTPIPTNSDDVPWIVVARLNHSPYMDKRMNKVHQPETRVYKSRLVKNDVMVGIESDVLHVTAAVYVDENGNEMKVITK